MNVRKILCPVDFSTGGEAAIGYASSLAKDHEAEVHFVYVWETGFTDPGFAGYVPPPDVEKEKAKLEKIVPTSSEVACEHAFIHGHPADELVEYAKNHEIDLIVMGTHGRTGLTRVLMGSVAEAVLRNAPCPVLTIKQPVLQEA